MLSYNSSLSREPAVSSKPIIPLVASTLVCLSLLIPARQAAAAPQVVASIAPLHALVAAVMQDLGSPRLLLHGSQSPHSFSLRPSDARMLQQADIVFWVGPVLELPLARMLPNLSHAQAVAMLDAPGVERLPQRTLDADPRADDGHVTEHRHSDDAPDPHIWLSPANAIAMGNEIARVLGTRDPGNSTRYQANAARLAQRLDALDRGLAQQFAGVDGRFAVFHDAYQYLERRYGLHSTGTVTSHPERSPGVAHLRALRARLVRDQVRCLFSEPQFQPRLVATLSEGLAIRHAVLDPLGTDIPPGPDAYEAMMQTIADRFTACMHRGANQ